MIEYQKETKKMLNRIRAGEDVREALRLFDPSRFSGKSVSVSQALAQTTAGPSIATQTPFLFEDWLQDSPLQTGTPFYFQQPDEHGHQVLLHEPQLDHGNIMSWTAVISDATLIEHLLALYFCWEYPIFASISQDHFMEDFRSGNTRYCSPLLVNALLALACRFSDRCEQGLGDIFFAEAVKLLKAEGDRHDMITVQTLGIMAIREASCGRIGESVFLSGQSIRLAIEMGLHVETDGEDKAVRETTFWGAFSLNEMLSLCTCSLPHLSERTNLPTKPPIMQHIEDALWVPYTDDGESLGYHFHQPSNIRSVYKTFCELSERVHNALYVLYTPGSEINSGTLITLYNSYIEWYDTIPETLRLGQNFTPAVLFAHLFYHSATLLLFQPFINLHLLSSSIIPLEVCLQAASAITGLVSSYSNLYTLRRTPSFLPYFVFQCCLIYLVALSRNPSDIMAKTSFDQGVRDLEEMSICHGFALRSIDTLRILAKRWEVDGEIGDSYGQSEMGEEGNEKLDHYSINAVEYLRKAQMIDGVGGFPLFSPFPLQGLPVVGTGEGLERSGFRVREWD